MTPGNLTREGVATLQRLAGNQAVLQMTHHTRRAEPYKLRSSSRNTRALEKARESGDISMPDEFKALSTFSLAVRSKFAADLWDEIGIHFVPQTGKRMVWWISPLTAVEEFVYTGDRQDDINDLNATSMRAPGYTWHHTGYPFKNTEAGVMQLVPTDQHSAISHVGAIWADRH